MSRALLNVADYERRAAEVVDPAVLAFVDGGAGDERTLRANLEAYRRWFLRPRALVDVAEVTTATAVLGTQVSMPVLLAPVGLQTLVHPDGELASARAAAAAGVVMCLSTISTFSPAELAAAAPLGPRWFQLYCFSDRGLTRELAAQAAHAGFEALAVTVDGPVLALRDRADRAGFRMPDVTLPALGRTPAELGGLLDRSLTWGDVADLAGAAGLPLIVKGILAAEDAELACEHGAAGVVVSNHGGRQLDGALASLDALPEVVEAVRGRAAVLLDGGVRRGIDVAIALALGADAVLVGRPLVWGLAVSGEEGVRDVLEMFRRELELALVMLGCRSRADLTRSHVREVR